MSKTVRVSLFSCSSDEVLVRTAFSSGWSGEVRGCVLLTFSSDMPVRFM